MNILLNSCYVDLIIRLLLMSLNDFGSMLNTGDVSMLLPFTCIRRVPEMRAKASASKGSFSSPS